MIANPFELIQDENSPLDLVEDVAITKSWQFLRLSDEELRLDIKGKWGEYNIFLIWQDEFQALQLSCEIDLFIGNDNREAAAQLLMTLNERLWLGHFDLLPNNHKPAFRHTTIFKNIPSTIAIDTIESVLDICLAECDRFYPTLQMLTTGDLRANETLSAAMFETVGEA